MVNIEGHYSAHNIEQRILTALRTAGLDPTQRLTPAQLGALDHFHTGGYNSSLILQELARIRAGHRVLDVGAGLAGAARMLAAAGCQVDCVELTDDYCVGAELLNRLTGLQDQVNVWKGSALALSFPNHTFDVVWMQNVGMNIEDKHKLYTEIHRVLKPGGCFAFQEMTSGAAGAPDFPLPWASTPAHNFLLAAQDMQAMLEAIGFTTEYFEDVSDSQLPAPASAATPVAPPPSAPQPTLSLSTYVDNLGQKADNAQRSLKEGKVRFYRGVFRVKA